MTSPPVEHPRQFQTCFLRLTEKRSIPPHRGQGPQRLIPPRNLIPRLAASSSSILTARASSTRRSWPCRTQLGVLVVHPTRRRFLGQGPPAHHESLAFWPQRFEWTPSSAMLDRLPAGIRGAPTITSSSARVRVLCSRMAEPAHDPVNSRSLRCLRQGRSRHRPGEALRHRECGHAWLHSDCWPEWHRTRQADAIAALAAMGIKK